MRALAWVVGLAYLIYPNLGRTQGYVGTYVGDALTGSEETPADRYIRSALPFGNAGGQ